MTLPEAGLMRSSGIEPYKQRSRKNLDLRSESAREREQSLHSYHHALVPPSIYTIVNSTALNLAFEYLISIGVSGSVIHDTHQDLGK